MARSISGSGKIRQRKILLYDLSVLGKKIRFNIFLTLADNEVNRKPTPVTSLYNARLEEGNRTIKRPPELEPRKMTVCFDNEQTRTVYVPYRNSSLEHNPQIKETYDFGADIVGIRYEGETVNRGMQFLAKELS